jgi:hypothetical protein
MPWLPKFQICIIHAQSTLLLLRGRDIREKARFHVHEMPAHGALVEGQTIVRLIRPLHEARLAVQIAVLIDGKLGEFVVLAIESLSYLLVLVLLFIHGLV